MDPRIIELMQTVKTPLELNCKAGDRLVIVTDFEFESIVWQAMSAAATQMGIEVTVVMMPARPAHQAEPTAAVAEAMKAADVNIYLTSKAMVHSQAAKAAKFEKNIRTIIMEQATYSILTSPIAKAFPRPSPVISALLGKMNPMHIITIKINFIVFVLCCITYLLTGVLMM